MHSLRQYWRNVREQLGKRFELHHARALERETSTVTEEYRARLLEIQGIQTELDSLRRRHEEQLTDLQQRIIDAEAAREAARHQFEALKLRLTEASSRLESTESRLTDSEAARGAAQQQIETLENALTEASSRLESTESRLTDIEAARDAAHQKIETLENALNEASSRLVSTENRIGVLDGKLEKRHMKHQADLQKAQLLAHKQQRRLGWAFMIAAFAFILASVVSVTRVWNVDNNTELLADLSQDIKDMKLSMEQHLIDSLHGTPGDYASPTAAMPVMEQELDTVQPQPENESMQPEGAMPEPDSVPDQNLYGPTASFHSRQEMSDYFKENALQPNVISLKSGLQYKVLSRGNGRSPKATDTVVISYLTPGGTEFDSSYTASDPVTLVVNEAIPGIREALQRMEEGAQWELHIPPNLAYRGVRKRGKSGFKPLIYMIELNSILEADSAVEP